MVEGPSSMWDNLEVTFSKIKKFRSNKASFPLFDSLGELYDGHLAEGNYNCTSLGEQEEPLRQVGMEDDVQELDDVVLVDQNDDREAADVSVENSELLASREEEAEGSSAARLQQGRRNKDEPEEKRPKKSSRVENMMERYLEMKTKQVADESAQLAKEKEHAQGADFSVKKCISMLRSMEVTKEEKAKAYAVFKAPENGETFLCAFEDDPESALIWLKSEMAKLQREQCTLHSKSCC